MLLGVNVNMSQEDTQTEKMHDIADTRYGLGKVIATGWYQYRKHFKSILPIFLIVYVPINIALSFVPVDYLIENHGLDGFRLYMKLIELTEFFIGVLATMSLARLIKSSLIGSPVTWQAALHHAGSRWAASIGTGLLAGVIVLGLLLLLIVPGVIWGLYYVFFVYVVALRGLSGKAALDYSKGIVKGQWWRVLGYLAVIQVLALAASLAVTSPFFFMPEGRIIEILSNTLSDIVSALFLAMTAVFFLNNDFLRIMSEEHAPLDPAVPADDASLQTTGH